MYIYLGLCLHIHFTLSFVRSENEQALMSQCYSVWIVKEQTLLLLCHFSSFSQATHSPILLEPILLFLQKSHLYQYSRACWIPDSLGTRTRVISRPSSMIIVWDFGEAQSTSGDKRVHFINFTQWFFHWTFFDTFMFFSAHCHSSWILLRLSWRKQTHHICYIHLGVFNCF